MRDRLERLEDYEGRIERMDNPELLHEIKSYYKQPRPPIADLAVMELLIEMHVKGHKLALPE